MLVGRILRAVLQAAITPVSWAFKLNSTDSKVNDQADRIKIGEPTPTGDEPAESKPLNARLIDRITNSSLIQFFKRILQTLGFVENTEKKEDNVSAEDKKTVTEFETKVDGIKTRDQALGEAGDKLKAEIEIFLRDNPNLAKLQKQQALRSLQTLNHVRLLFKTHDNITELSKFQLGANGCLNVPPDGNCLYYSLQAALTLGLGLKDIPEPLELRKKIFEWIRANYKTDELMGVTIGAAIEEYNEKQDRKISEELASWASCLSGQELEEQQLQTMKSYPKIQSPEEFLMMADQQNFWGSSPDLFAAARMYNLQIFVTEVKRELNQKEEKISYERKPVAGEDGAIAVYFKLTNNNHYDLLLEETQAAHAQNKK